MTQRTILVVDDNPNYLKQMSLILRDAGYAVIVAGNGEQAIDLAQKVLPDVIVIDWDMPKLNGAEAIKILKDLELTTDIPIIMATGVMTTPTDLQAIFKLGAADFVRKPVESIELLARINAALQIANSVQALKEESQTKSRLLALVSHDLRSPLSSFQGILTYMKMAGQENLTMNEIYRLITGVEEEFNAVLSMANSLLFWALNQEDAIHFEQKEVDLKSLLEQSMQAYALSAKEKAIDLSLFLEEETFIQTDTNMLRFIFRNLLANAIKYTPKNGEVKIEVSAQNNQLQLSVTDTGIGIAQTELKQLFQSISTAKSTADTYGRKGTGLGLAVAYDFAQKMGGELSVSSEVGKGSTFSLSLPIEVEVVKC